MAAGRADRHPRTSASGGASGGKARVKPKAPAPVIAPVLDADLRTRATEGDRTATEVLDAAGGAVVQAKLAVGSADDPWERAADAAADAALRRLAGGSAAPPDPAGDGGGTARRAATGGLDQRGGGDASPEEERAIRSAAGGGALPDGVRRRMERGFGTDLSGVRVHDDDRAHRLAAGLQATAFTAGSSIWFGKGAYDPGSARGQRVLAHELAHVVQQQGGAAAPVRRLVSAKQFRASTYTMGHQRGDAIKAIDKHLAEIEQLTAAYNGTAPKKKASTKGKGSAPSASSSDDNAKIANLERRIQLISEIEDMAQRWIDDHMISTTLPAAGAAGAAPGSGGAPGSGAPAPTPRAMDDPKRKRRMDGVRVLLNGGTYTHEKNKTDKEVVQKAGLTSLVSERQGLQITLLSLRAAAGQSAPVAGAAPAPGSKRYEKIKKKYEGKASSMFTVLAPVVNAAVPNSGDAVEVDLEAKIPIDQHAMGFILFHLVLSAQRDSVVGEIAGSEGHQNVVLHGELTAGAGVNVADFLQLKGELGVYAESSANTADGALTLLSYGVYRRWRESRIVPNGLVSQLWSGRSGEFGYQKSEEWANQVEKEQFSDSTTPSGAKDKNDAYVETGVLGRVSGKAGKKFNGVGAEIEASLTFGGGRRYNKESVERAKGQGQLGAANKDAKGQAATSAGGAQQLLSDDTFFFQVAGSANVSPISGGFKVIGKFSRPASRKLVNPNPWVKETVELQVDAGFTIPLAGSGADVASKIVRPITSALAELPGLVRTAVEKKKGELGGKKDQAARGVGVAMDSVTGSLPTLSQFAHKFGETDTFSSIGTDLTEAAGPTVGSNLTLGLAIGTDFTSQMVIEISTQSKLEVEIPVFFTGSISKTKRVIAITISKSGVKVK